MNKTKRKILLYFIVVFSSLILFAYILLPLWMMHVTGGIKRGFNTFFTLLGYYGLLYWLYEKYYPRLKQFSETHPFFKF